MRKKYVLKKWVKVVLGIMFGIGFILGAMDFDDTKVFMISKGIAMVLMFIPVAIAWTQTSLFE